MERPAVALGGPEWAKARPCAGHQGGLVGGVEQIAGATALMPPGMNQEAGNVTLGS